MSILKVFQKLTKGNEGETQVVESITRLLKDGDQESNFFIIPKVQIEDFNTNREIDLILLHPVYGIFVIEVKNWTRLEFNEKNNPFEQAKTYKNILLSNIETKLDKIPISVEFRVIFPSLSYEDASKFFKENPNYQPYKTNSFFKNDFESKENFKRFFKTTNTIYPNKKEFLSIAEILIDKNKIKESEEKILPIITHDEILFFDYKQLSILNGYTGGFRIIRGVAGTGKTVILSHFINNKLNKDSNQKFLVLCFNKKLVENIQSSFAEHEYQERIQIESIFKFIKFTIKLKHPNELNDNDFDGKFKYYETDEALEEFRTKLKEYLKTNPIDYLLCDETQDMPSGFTRILYEEIHDCIFFIDEAQKFYSYSMNKISEVFHHPKFEKLSMQGRVKNLKNVYRTPSNIAKCAFEILSNDTKINQYYKQSHYLNNDFLNDINFVLEDGQIHINNWNDFNELSKLIEQQTLETIVLTYTKKQKEAIHQIITKYNKQDNVTVMTMQGVKGLEAQNIIIHSFDYFLNNTFKHEKDIFYKKIYVLITRAQKNLYISIDKNKIEQPEIDQIIKILEPYSYIKDESDDDQKTQENESSIGLSKLTKLIPSKKVIKEVSKVLVLGAEVFAVISGLFSS